MKHCLSVFFFIILSFALSNNVSASVKSLGFAGMLFGSDEKIEKIQDLEGTDYKLSHKFTLHFFIAGIYLSDDGYVLQKKTDFSGYYPLDNEKIQELQQNGMLPSPLPKYSISFWEYLFGYSLWLVIAFALFWVVGIPLILARWRRLRGIRDCPSCGLQLTPEELKSKFCGACSTPFQDI